MTAAQIFPVAVRRNGRRLAERIRPGDHGSPHVTNWIVFGCNDESVLGGLNALAAAGVKPDAIIGVGLGAYEACKPWAADQPIRVQGSPVHLGHRRRRRRRSGPVG